MAITISPVTCGFVAEIGDVDLSQPLTPSQVDAIKQAFWDYAVLIFPEQDLVEQQPEKINFKPLGIGKGPLEFLGSAVLDLFAIGGEFRGLPAESIRERIPGKIDQEHAMFLRLDTDVLRRQIEAHVAGIENAAHE